MLIYTKKNRLLSFLNMIVLVVLFFIFPFYLWQGDSSNTVIRNASYFLALMCTAILFACELKIINKKILYYGLINLTGETSVLIFQVLCINLGSKEATQSYLISSSYCWIGFVLGRFLFHRTNEFHSKIMIVIIWLANLFFIISKVNWDITQSVYGADDAAFDGVYQYIGDVFAFVSILLISQLIGDTTNNNQKDIIKKEKLFGNLKISKKQFRQFTKIKIPRKQFSKLKILLCLIIIILSASGSFLNGSRASFVSLATVLFLIIIRIISFNLKKTIVYGSILFLCFTVSFSNIANHFGINTEVILENRNLEMLMEGKSSSLDERTEIQEEGIAEIWRNPLIGNYTAINLSTQEFGNYIHNALGTWQYFGLIPFVTYVLAIFECLNIFFKRVRFGSISENIAYGGSLMFCLISILFFRMPISFFCMFIVFGLFSTFDGYKQKVMPPYHPRGRSANRSPLLKKLRF